MLSSTLETTYFNAFNYYSKLDKTKQKIFLHNFQQMYPEVNMATIILNEKHLKSLENG